MDKDHKKTYIYNAIALAVLTILELGVIQLPLAKMGQIVLLLTFAVTKMALVAMIFMHLRYETKVLRRILFLPIPAAIYFAWGIMYDMSYSWLQ
ncbi:MAG: cytochrome C oxidase subunit IV family protein [Candidatus Marinimicrobia bacterium]|nr:cytochrome C oxidase subunit IV family protein [Candidatus Neomarinimicrobiota bacterium]